MFIKCLAQENHHKKKGDLRVVKAPLQLDGLHRATYFFGADRHSSSPVSSSSLFFLASRDAGMSGQRRNGFPVTVATLDSRQRLSRVNFAGKDQTEIGYLAAYSGVFWHAHLIIFSCSADFMTPRRSFVRTVQSTGCCH